MKKSILLFAGLAVAVPGFSQLSGRAVKDSVRKAWLDTDTRFEKGAFRLNVTPILQGVAGSGGYKNFNLGAGVGLGYFPLKNLAADLDLFHSWSIQKPVDYINQSTTTARLSLSYYVRINPSFYYTPGISFSTSRYSYTPSDSLAYFGDVANTGRQNHFLTTGTVWPVGLTMKVSPRTSLQFGYGFSRVLNQKGVESLPYNRNHQNMQLKIQFRLGK